MVITLRTSGLYFRRQKFCYSLDGSYKAYQTDMQQTQRARQTGHNRTV